MEMSTLACCQVGDAEEGFLEIFDLIQEFQSIDGFSSWITNQKFENVIYKNEVMHGKYTREWAYASKKRSFFFGKLEFEEDKVPKDIKIQLLCFNSSFCEIQRRLRLEKLLIHSLLAESHYTVMSYIVHKGLIIGTGWEIYSLSTLLKLYEQKQDPLRYFRKIRRE